MEWNQKSNLSVAMDWGSRITLTWDYLDTNPVSIAPYNPSGTNVQEHLWNVEGTYYPSVST